MNYQQYYPCFDETSAEREADYEDSLSRLRGEASRFARTGFYDRLFRRGNTWNGDLYNIPTYGFSANYKKDGPY
ncbi:unnamed protein product, partial [Mesorhabditis belari]|uniref:Uncharacterized protein n=1 Tax=Mesorhabditis belari TaxID=2138241 RepID=A0AAF3F0W8_9BILA